MPPPPTDYGSSQGGYSPPPAQGGYTPPPPGGGGYSPPPAGGGGYGNYGGTPPPGSAGAGGFSQSDLQSVFQSWINAATKPNVMTYESELGNATWAKVLIGVGLVALVSFLVNLLFASAVNASLNPLFDQIQNQLKQQGRSGYVGNLRNLASGGGAFGALIGTFITFFLGAGWLYLMARLFGGQPSNFLTHTYTLSISYAPLRTLGAILSVIPCVGLIVLVYQLYLSGLALQASHRMTAGRAQMAVWIPVVVLLMLGCACSVLAIGLIAGLISNSQP